MRLKKIEVIAAVLLLLSIFIIGFRLLHKEPLGFIIQNGNVIPIENTNYFTINDILIVIIFSWIGGMAALYLLLSKTEASLPQQKAQEGSAKDKYGYISNLLKPDEKNIFNIILHKNGEILQKDLVNEAQMSIVRVSRILDRLEKKNLVEKKRYGATNKIVVKNI